MTTQLLHADQVMRRHPGAADLNRYLANATDWIKRAMNRYQQRRVLAQLEPRLLDDVGISRQLALREASKPLWS